MSALLVIKLIDLALMGGAYAAEALAARDRLAEMEKRGGPTPEELAELEAATDTLLDQIRRRATGDG